MLLLGNYPLGQGLGLPLRSRVGGVRRAGTGLLLLVVVVPDCYCSVGLAQQLFSQQQLLPIQPLLPIQLLSHCQCSRYPSSSRRAAIVSATASAELAAAAACAGTTDGCRHFQSLAGHISVG